MTPDLIAQVRLMTETALTNRHTPTTTFNYATKVMELLRSLDRGGYILEYAPTLRNGMVLEHAVSYELAEVTPHLRPAMTVSRRLVSGWEEHDADVV